MESVGFIGLGNMGGGMAANIQRAGYPMTVYDLREAAALPLLEGGARLANSPAEVAASSDITFTSLPGPREVAAVALGREGVPKADAPVSPVPGAALDSESVLEGIRPGGVYIDLSSSRPTLIREIAPQFPRQRVLCAGCASQRGQKRGRIGQSGGDGGRRSGGL